MPFDGIFNPFKNDNIIATPSTTFCFQVGLFY